MDDDKITMQPAAFRAWRAVECFTRVFLFFFLLEGELEREIEGITLHRCSKTMALGWMRAKN